MGCLTQGPARPTRPAPSFQFPPGYVNSDEQELRDRGRYWPVSDEPSPLSDPKEQGCFENARAAAALRPSWRYAEGLTWILGRWVHHAWAVDEDGRAVECTWPARGERYFGVVFEREEYQARAQVPSPSATGVTTQETRQGNLGT